MIPLFIENFLPNQVLNILHSYCIMKYSNKTNFEVDSQTSSLISEHSDPLMETILDLTTPVVEQNVGKKLFPTYSFLRIYDKNSDLPIHKDRPSCEYTVALCLGADPAEKPYEIFVGEVDETSDYKYFDSEGNFNRYKINYKYPMKPNNALIFKGMDNIHWREICGHDHFITVFLHYVDQEGEFKEYKYDKRNMLGAT
jgi:hypothetical protein